jgi:hypothetical protein
MVRQENDVLRIVCSATVLMCIAPTLFGQGGYAIVSGRVQDASRAVVPGVSVAAKNVSTDVTLSALSNRDGYYTFTNLIPGKYTITARQTGFKNLERNGIALQVGGEWKN